MYYKSYQKEKIMNDKLKLVLIIVIFLLMAGFTVCNLIKTEELVCDSGYVCKITRTYYTGKVNTEVFNVDKSSYMAAEVESRRESSGSSSHKTRRMKYYIRPVIYAAHGAYNRPFVKDFGSSSRRITVEDAENRIKPYIDGFDNYIKNPANGFSMQSK